jgi:hypothetical protein
MFLPRLCLDHVDYKTHLKKVEAKYLIRFMNIKHALQRSKTKRNWAKNGSSGADSGFFKEEA